MLPLAMLLVLAACSASSGSVAPTAPTTPTSVTTPVVVVPGTTTTRADIRLSLSLYVVADAGSPDTGLGTQRTVAEVEAIAVEMGQIWAQAGVTFNPVRVLQIEMPSEVLTEIAATGRTDAFFAQAGRTFDLPDAGAINGFYVQEAAGVNGFTPIGSRVFFVVDEPSVNDRRVSSHEIGHILGLHHDAFDPSHLMFSGTNGELLTDVEQGVARYSAQGILDGVR